MKQHTAIILLFLFFLVPAYRAAAQLMHGVGIGMVNGFGKLPKDADPSESQPFLGAKYISYYPRFQVTSGDYNSITIGMPLILGLGGASNNAVPISYYVDLPLMIEANAGVGSTPKDDSFLGYSVGLGFGYATAGNKYTYLDNTLNTKEKKVAVYGPMAQLQFRVKCGESALSFRSAYKMGLNDLKYNLFDIGVYLLF